MDRRVTVLCFSFCLFNAAHSLGAAEQDEFFEKRIRPLLANHCWKCHSDKRQESGLRLDSAAGLKKGGESGPAIRAKQVESSLLITAVRQTTALKMPPNGKLPSKQISYLEQWVKMGASWPNTDQPKKKDADTKPESITSGSTARLPNDPAFAKSLQLWLKADSLKLADGTKVHVWTDNSGRGHDLSATAGIRVNGVGTPPTFVKRSKVNGRSAVRFGAGNGMAASPDHVLDIKGDAALTIILVGIWTPLTINPSYDNVLMIGNPAAKTKPNRPLAAYLEIDRGKRSFDFAGGWAYDAQLGPDSEKLLYESPRLIALTKSPGPMTANTRFYFEGRPSASFLGRPLSGSSAVPDFQHRDDIGVAIGKAANFSGHVSGDYAEVIVYNRVLQQEERRSIENYLIQKYGMLNDEMVASANRTFSAEEKSHWAFQPIDNPPIPQIKQADWARTPIDRFIAARLDSKRLAPSPRADRRRLIRRVAYDLTGLPPTPNEINDFLDDPSEDSVAFAQLVDRLLASPQYGERWGRHWLDVVRYADTTANDGNFVMRFAFRYRDYVLDSFNQDRSYDEFLMHQLAGDLMPDADPRVTAERTMATGFLMVGPKALAETDKEQVRMDIVDEQIDATGRAMLGLTISCARCHDHKFDPIPTVDYYSIAGIFRSTEMFSDLVRNASMWMEYEITAGSEQKIPVMAPKDGAAVDLRVHLRGNRFRLGQVAPRRFLQVVAGEGHDVLRTSSSGRLQLAQWIANDKNPLTARVMVNRIWQGHFGRGLVSTSGNFGKQGELPSHPQLLDWLASRFIESGWSVKAMHRLILSSAVWQQSSIPSSDVRQLAETADGDNRFLWRFPRRRLDAEEIRDSLLKFGGHLNPVMRGGEIVMRLFNEGEFVDKKRGVSSASKVNNTWPGFNSNRRSIYLPVVRNGQPDVLALFDVADANAVTPVRNETTVASQAAFLMNSKFSTEQATGMATDLIANFKTDEERLSRSFQLILGRQPTSIDQKEFLNFVNTIQQSQIESGVATAKARQFAWARLCQTVFCMNEFLYVN